MNVKKDKKGHRTMNFVPFGRVRLRDAKTSIRVPLIDEDVRKGKRNSPSACAIAVALKRNAIEAGTGGLVPGFLAVQVKKTATLVLSSKKGRLVVDRFTHPAAVTKAINGFDTAGSDVLKTGDVALLQAPRGHKRIGKNNGTSRPGNVVAKNPTARKACVRRGVYLDPVHGKQAKVEDADLNVVA